MTAAPYGSGSIAPFFEGAAVMVVLVLIGMSLENRARARSSEAIRKLIRLTPTTARVVLADGGEEERALGDVQVGDIVRISPGQRIPVDGMIKEGNTTVDESVLTGEATRSGRGPGMVVMAGTENGLGTVTVEVRRVNEDTALAHVIALVGRAQRARAPLQRTADRIAVWLIPLAILVGSGTYALWYFFGPPGSQAAASVCAIGVLVAACPVALGLAAPTAVVIGIGRASRAGILFRDGEALERLAGINTVLFDKTGTLTEGRMKLIGLEPNVGITAEDLLAMAAAVERGSLHPVGLAIVWEASRRQVPFATAEGVEEIPGKGIRGTVNGHTVAIGKLGFIQASGAAFELMLGSARTNWARGHSVVFVGRDAHCIGIIILSDNLRADAGTAVAGLIEAGVKPILVTGDHAEVANAIAQRVGIETVVADMVPAEKYAVVQAQKKEGRSVAMCGDGVNDAPALAAADVGIAMGTGSEIAVSTAGIALAQPDLKLLLSARQLSHATVQTIKRNLAIAFIYTAIAVPIAAGILFPLGGGLVSPVWQAAGMAITSLIVVANSQRLGRR
jgi:Cu+-exporting ATPase